MMLNEESRRTNKNQQEGKSQKDKLLESKKITSGCLFKVHIYQIGGKFDLHSEKQQKDKEDRKLAQQKPKEIQRLAREAATALLSLQSDPTK